MPNDNLKEETSYDKVPYGSHPFLQSHPDRLATLGRLFGMTPKPVTDCRVLELGCSSGGNLTPMAYQLPKSEFVGIDFSARQVEMGQAMIRALNLQNISIEHASILDIDKSWGEFDYIIAHGVFSWVPTQVQEKIFAICSANLAPQGIAYISYNTHPGWRMREMLRDMMLYHIRQIKDPSQQVDQAKALIDFLSRHVPTENNPYGLVLKSELEIINRSTDWYLFHDHLEEVNDPVYFYQFAERAGFHGLQYLGESDFGTMLTTNFPQEVKDTLNQLNRNIIGIEQYMDFLRNRRFRQTLLCRNTVPLRRNIGPAAVNDFLLSGAANSEKMPVDLSPGVTCAFRNARGQSIHTNRPLAKAALLTLREHWPLALDLDTLLNKTLQKMDADPALKNIPVQREKAVLAGDMLQAYTVSIVEFRTWQADFVTRVSAQPKVSDIAAYQNRQGEKSVVNMRHEQIAADPLTQHLISILDGTRDRAAVLAHLGGLIKSGALSAHKDNQPIKEPEDIREALTHDVERRLAYLAGSALLVS